MREIKFRAWDKIHNEMIDPDFVEIKGNGIIKIYNENCEEWIEDENFVFPMQYTGLKNKNGKEIYEGDIVDSGIGDDVVVPDMFNHNNMSHFEVNAKDWEIFGNIYENPELLKEV